MRMHFLAHVCLQGFRTHFLFPSADNHRGDAIADPLTGMHAALAVGESLHRGGGEVIEFALASVAAEYAALPLISSDGIGAVAEPAAPVLSSRAGELGADNAAVREMVRERAAAAC